MASTETGNTFRIQRTGLGGPKILLPVQSAAETPRVGYCKHPSNTTSRVICS
jgi:hypothetical protein